ncbi:hypothetical protein ADK67_03405 [Saccharothrix sp. NRRL B-16348]|nr:hypothetical protein ADK67_03405 [Saccharothrix sp. NRRL B-16348]
MTIIHLFKSSQVTDMSTSFLSWSRPYDSARESNMGGRMGEQLDWCEASTSAVGYLFQLPKALFCVE